MLTYPLEQYSPSRWACRAFSDSDSHPAVSGYCGIKKKTAMPSTTEGIPSRMNSHLQASRPQAPFMWPTPYAMALLKISLGHHSALAYVPPKCTCECSTAQKTRNSCSSFFGLIPETEIKDHAWEDTSLCSSEEKA